MARSDEEGREGPDLSEGATQDHLDAPSREDGPPASNEQLFTSAIARNFSGLMTPRVSSGNTPNLEDAANSLPMTATSDSSHHSSPGASGPSATHYGTRSRNRPAASRPNYAEDFEMDFEKPIHAAARQRATSPSGSPPAEAGHSPDGGKGDSWDAINNNSNGTSTSIPGTSTFSANPDVLVPKKRRAAQNASGLALSVSGHSSSRRTTQAARESRSNMFSFERCANKLKNGKLVADDGTQFAVNDYVYLVCEPPGDPYYLARIMEFRSRAGDSTINQLRVNWVYRPRDVQRHNIDMRLVYVTMHSDICPLTSLRGRCHVNHRLDFDDLDQYRRQPDHFYFNQAFDRFIHRWYEVIPTRQVVNVPENVKQALDERWRYIMVEPTKVRELTSAAKLCKRCTVYCANTDSVECAVCHNTYHMTCVRPPLLKKPSRGFAWACAPCSRAQEKKLEARRTPIIGNSTDDAEDEEMVEEDDDDLVPPTTAPSPQPDDRPATEAEIAHAKLWTMRYLGIHCRIEDALQYDDRAIYPRASSRIGPKHQATVPEWYGHAVELVKPVEIKKRAVKTAGGKKDHRLSKEDQAALEAHRAAKASRPPWVMDEPPGYVARGEDHSNKDAANTARSSFKMPDMPERGLDDNTGETAVDAYMERAKRIANDIGVKHYSVDFMDRALFLFQETGYDADAALKQLRKTEPGKSSKPDRGLRDPRYTLTNEEKKKFDDGVSKYGSELRMVRLHAKIQSHGDVVRYWYHWKKTDRGNEIWGSYGGRKNTKRVKAENDAASKQLDEIAHDHDDSAFDSGKIDRRGKRMVCKHCSRRTSRIWCRAPGPAASGESKSSRRDNVVVALCERCARLWRRYAIKWENQDEIGKRVAQGGGRTWKKRVDEELLKEWELESAGDSVDAQESSVAPSNSEPSRKRLRLSLGDNVPERRKAPPPPRPVTPPPLQPSMPKLKDWPCAICEIQDPENDQVLVCRDCRLTVHRRCYGQPELRNSSAKWSCDMCLNDRKETASVVGSSNDPASYEYNCILCPVHVTQRELVEPPRVSHKKKNDRERDRERIEKQLAAQLGEQYRQQQKDRGRPQLPREALKRTTDNNWVHITCATFIPDIKFSRARTLEAAEGVPFALQKRKGFQCCVCKETKGATVACESGSCGKHFHVSCAIGAGFKFGFDITPVKSSRRDTTSIVSIGGETGQMSPVMWCKDHSASVKSVVHGLHEHIDERGSTALQLFSKNYKQADLTLTGTTRKANQLDDYTKLAHINDARRGSASAPSKKAKEADPERRCLDCRIDVSPRWWPAESRRGGDVTMGNGIVHEEAMVNGSSKKWHCNRCHWTKRDDSQPMDIDRPPAAVSPPNRPTPSWGPLSNIPAQAPTQGTWPPAAHMNQSPRPAYVGHQPSAYAAPPPPHPLPSGPPSLTGYHMSPNGGPPAPPVPRMHPPHLGPPPHSPIHPPMSNGVAAHSPPMGPMGPMGPMAPATARGHGPPPLALQDAYSGHGPRGPAPPVSPGHMPPAYGHHRGGHSPPVPAVHLGAAPAPAAMMQPHGAAGPPSRVGASANPSLRNLLDG